MVELKTIESLEKIECPTLNWKTQKHIPTHSPLLLASHLSGTVEHSASFWRRLRALALANEEVAAPIGPGRVEHIEHLRDDSSSELWDIIKTSLVGGLYMVSIWLVYG